MDTKNDSKAQPSVMKETFSDISEKEDDHETLSNGSPQKIKEKSPAEDH